MTAGLLTQINQIRHRICTIQRLGTVAGMTVILSGTPALAQLKPEAAPSALGRWTIDVAPEYFYWQEFVNGVKVDDESGLRYGLELSYKDLQDEGWLLAARFKIYYGSVDYNGGTWAGAPVKTTTDYYGGLGELRYGYRWNVDEDQYLDLMGGFGLEDWHRSLNGAGGYNEKWLPINLKAGLELSPKEKGRIVTLGVKVPVYTTEVIDFGRVGGGTVTLHPGTLPSFYAEAGYKFTKNLSVTAYFDSYFFAKSSSETEEISGMNYQVYQPQTESFEVGVKAGWAF